MSRHCEVLYDDDGTVLARVQVTGPLSDEEREAMIALIKAARAHFAKQAPATDAREGGQS